jgi:hypothetical protein
MRTCLLAFGMAALLVSGASAACTPQMVVDLQMRGANPQLIAQICGGGGPQAPTLSSVCATNFGFCPYRGPLGYPCTCFGPMGAAPGVAR